MKKKKNKLKFNGVNDKIPMKLKLDLSSFPKEFLDNMPKEKWFYYLEAKGCGDDIQMLSLEPDYSLICKVKCPECGSRKIYVFIEEGWCIIKCKECGKLQYIQLEKLSDFINKE
jgi:ribosomal protein S27E